MLQRHLFTLFPYTALFRSWMALPVGGMIAGFSSIWLLPSFGWPSLFVVAGALPLFLAILLAISMPESLTFLRDRKSTRLNSSHMSISYAVFCLKKKNISVT